VVLGAAVGPKNFDALFDFADGWIPFGRTFEQDHDAFLAECARRGEDPDRFAVSVWAPNRDDETLEGLRRRGVRRAVFTVPAGAPDEVIAELDRLAAFVV
jgi:alkanesulfonate monooxygenase SsuD/methylene tetrahydromethanopterin reductase-like flavin-dependent oxidoreductase (luciferase family)